MCSVLCLSAPMQARALWIRNPMQDENVEMIAPGAVVVHVQHTALADVAVVSQRRLGAPAMLAVAHAAASGQVIPLHSSGRSVDPSQLHCTA